MKNKSKVKKKEKWICESCWQEIDVNLMAKKLGKEGLPSLAKLLRMTHNDK